jgi:hypothetical protein
VLEDRRKKLVQPGERKLRFRLNAARDEYLHLVRRRPRILEQRSLPYTGDSPDDEDAASRVTRSLEQLSNEGALSVPPIEHLSILIT